MASLGQFRFHVRVMSGDNVVAQAFERFPYPIRSDRSERLRCEFERGNDCITSRFPAVQASASGLRPPQQ